MEYNNTVDLDTLKEQGITDDDLQGFTGEQSPDPIPESTPQVESELITEVVPEPAITPTTESEIVPDHDSVSKHVPYDRFKEVNDKNKVLMAKIAAFEAQQSQTTAPQQPAPVQQTPQQQVSIAEQITKIADEKVRKDLGITDDIETLQYTDPTKYLQYVKGVSKEEYRIEAEYNQQQVVYNENINFINELKSIPDFPVLYQFAEQELDELPRKDAKKIDDAYVRIDSGRGTKADFEIIRNFANQCKEKMNGINQAPAQGAFSTPTVTPTASPLDKASGLPRATNLGGARTASMSWQDVDKLASQGRFDEIPKDMLMQIHPDLAK